MYPQNAFEFQECIIKELRKANVYQSGNFAITGNYVLVLQKLPKAQKYVASWKCDKHVQK